MRYFLILMILCFSTEQLVAEDITARDFATGYYLEVDKKTAAYSLELPADVYRTVKSAELKDVRVFNNAGEVVEHDFRIVKTDPTQLRDKIAIPFFPLFQAIFSSEPAGFSLQVLRDNVGAIVNIQPEAKGETINQKVTGYLLDLSDLQKSASELEFYWKKDLNSSVFTVNIQQSSDLIRWTPLVHKATLADLQFGGQQVESRTVSLPREPLKYLKLTWQESDGPLRLTGISCYSQRMDARRKHQWVSLYNGIAREKDDQLMFYFETDYQLPTSNAQIYFPETNSIARLMIQSRPGSHTDWRTRCEQVFHDLSFEGIAIKNEPCSFASTADALWRVVVRQNGAGLQSGNRMLTLQLGWQPSELLFLGRGTPPYLLAFGSGKLAQQQKKTEVGKLLQEIQMETPSELIGRAQLGKRITLGGKLALQIPTKATPWKKWLLWSVLVLGVAMLAFMVLRLIKEMKADEEKRVSEKR